MSGTDADSSPRCQSWTRSSSIMPLMQRMRTSSGWCRPGRGVADLLVVDVRQHDVQDDEVRRYP